jgi:hypothetical protein
MLILRRFFAVIFVLIAIGLIYIDIDVIFNHGKHESVRWVVVIAYLAIAVLLGFGARALWGRRKPRAAP